MTSRPLPEHAAKDTRRRPFRSSSASAIVLACAKARRSESRRASQRHHSIVVAFLADWFTTLALLPVLEDPNAVHTARNSSSLGATKAMSPSALQAALSRRCPR